MGRLSRLALSYQLSPIRLQLSPLSFRSGPLPLILAFLLITRIATEDLDHFRGPEPRAQSLKPNSGCPYPVRASGRQSDTALQARCYQSCALPALPSAGTQILTPDHRPSCCGTCTTASSR